MITESVCKAGVVLDIVRELNFEVDVEQPPPCMEGRDLYKFTAISPLGSRHSASHVDPYEASMMLAEMVGLRLQGE